jgi:hypothetical protein
MDLASRCAQVAAASLLVSTAASSNKRHLGDSNPCGQSPMDFESISLATRTKCHVLRGHAPPRMKRPCGLSVYGLELARPSCAQIMNPTNTHTATYMDP